MVRSIKVLLKCSFFFKPSCGNIVFEEDIMNLGNNSTFVEHFFTQKYQSKMYQQCKDNLKVGECLLLQDFSRNRDIYHQDEVKAFHWSKKQVSMHPTVMFCKVQEDQDPERLVVTHLSDYTTHDAHVVYYFTKDCIQHIHFKVQH